jgi:shikimate dehydrogenase
MDFSINGKTRLAGVIGNPITHTLSPAMHNAAFQTLGIAAVYVPLGVPEAGLIPLIETLQSLKALGANVTVPYKEKVFAWLGRDHCSDNANKIGAVNTLIFKDGEIFGHNTDSLGFSLCLHEAGFLIPGNRAVLLGGGGAARAVAFPLLNTQIRSLAVSEIDRERVDRMALDLKDAGEAQVLAMAPHSAELRAALQEADLIINATPLGLKLQDPLPVDQAWLPSGRCVMDLVYGAGDTPFLAAARAKGNKVIPGWQMLLHQGAAAFELWTNQPAPLAEMKKALLRAGGIQES